jgi:hypothetical protein
MRVGKYVQAFVQLTERLLSGSMIGDPDVFGQTLQMERQSSNVAQWPGEELAIKVVNEDLRLYGGAQVRLCMDTRNGSLKVSMNVCSTSLSASLVKHTSLQSPSMRSPLRSAQASRTTYQFTRPQYELLYSRGSVDSW